MDKWNATLTIVLGLTAIMFLGSLLVAWFLILRMPADYLTRKTTPDSYLTRHPVFRIILQIARNTLGGVLLAIGIIMLVTPGQGVLFIFLGLSLVDFPGKRKMVRCVLGRPGILKTINKIRAKGDRPPLELPFAAADDARNP